MVMSRRSVHQISHSSWASLTKLLTSTSCTYFRFIDISDHCLIFCTRKDIKNVFNKQNTVKIRSMRDYSKEAFQTNLSNADWNSVMTSDDVIDAW